MRLVLLKIEPILLSSFCSRCIVVFPFRWVVLEFVRLRVDRVRSEGERFDAGARLFSCLELSVLSASSGCLSFESSASIDSTGWLSVGGDVSSEVELAGVGSSWGGLAAGRRVKTAIKATAMIGTKNKRAFLQAERGGSFVTWAVTEEGNACVSWTRRAPSMSQKACSSS